MCYFNKCFLGSPISFLETSQFFIHLQPSYKGKKIMLFFSQKDYKMLHGLLWGRRVFLVYLEKYFQGQFCRHFFAVLSAFPATFRKYQPFPAMPRIVFWLKKAPGRSYGLFRELRQRFFQFYRCSSIFAMLK